MTTIDVSKLDMRMLNPRVIKVSEGFTVDTKKLESIISSIRNKGSLPHIVIDQDNSLIDGVEALEAAIALKQEKVLCHVYIVPNKEKGAFRLIDIDLIEPHPLQRQIYGESEDLSKLEAAIALTGRIDPLLVTPIEGGYRAIAGHSRRLVAKKMGITQLLCQVMVFESELEERKAFLSSNVQREKTPEQKVREGMEWEAIEREDAKLRQKTKEPKGNVRDIVGEKVGLSGVSYETAKKVVKVIDAAPEEEAEKLRSLLNEKSINAAAKEIKAATSVKGELKQKQEELGLGRREQILPSIAPNTGMQQEEPQLQASQVNLSVTGDALVAEVAIALIRLSPEQLGEAIRRSLRDMTEQQVEAIDQAVSESYKTVAA